MAFDLYSSDPYTFGSLNDNTSPAVSGIPASASIPVDTAPASTSSGLSSFFGGFLSKAAEVGLDIVAAKNQPVSVYPTGQTNPAQLQQQAVAAQAAQSDALKKYLLIGGASLAGVVVLLMVLRKK